MGRPPCCDKSNVKRGLWTPEEDAKILAHVAAHGTGNWTSVPKKAGLKRCGKSCRLRWTNYLRPDLKHDKFTPQEEELIVNLHSTLGSRWSLIAGQLPGRTDNDVKNYWNTKLKKKLKEMGIDPVTHKPFSQILTEYANISGLPKSSGSRIGSLNRDLKNKVIFKSSSEQPLSPIISQEYSISNITNHCSMATRAPKMEPLMMQDITSPHNNNSLELLAQLQTINMVQPANAPINCIYNQDFYTIQPSGNYFFNTEASVSSSSSSSNIIQKNSSQPGFPSPADTTPSSPFSWSEFLLEDLCFPPNDQTQEDVTGGGLSSTGSSEKEFVIDNGIYNNNFHGFGNAGHGHMTVSSVETGNVLAGMTSSSLDDSFMDVMLDQDNQLSWDFPSLLEEQYFY